MTLKNSNVMTDSAREVYYVYIEGLYSDECINSSNGRRTFPVYIGSPVSLNFNLIGPLKTSYNYMIFDQSGQPTNDNVIIDLFFELSE